MSDSSSNERRDVAADGRRSLLAKLDRPVYVPAQNVALTPARLAVAGVAAVVGLLTAVAISSQGPVGVVVGAALTPVLIGSYIVWRRGRNRRLTGDPTTWPDEDL